MPTNTESKIRNLYPELNELKRLERLIASRISPTLLDYAFIFAPDVGYQISLSSLTKEGAELLNAYINKADAFLKIIGAPVKPRLENILDTFLDRLHDMYYARFMDARLIYGEYEFYRIPTLFELQLEKNTNGVFKLPAETTSLFMEGALVVDDMNQIDWPKTVQQEVSKHMISCYVAGYKNAQILGYQMFRDLEAVTTRGFAYLILERDMHRLIQDVLEQVFFYFGGEVFKYINKGYELEESVSNVYEYYLSQAKTVKGFMKFLKPLFTDVDATVMDTLNDCKEMDKPTKDMIIDDFNELLVAYFKLKKLFPRDYYAMEIRDPDQFYKWEEGNNYEKIIDLHMILPEGGVTEMALESFYIDFSTEAKTLIFSTVVGNDVENPMFTLNNYLKQ